jgi:hypothetical protein
MPATEIVVQDQLNHAVSTVTFVAGALEMVFKNNGFCKLIVKTGATPTGNLTVKSRVDSNRRSGDIVVAMVANKVYESSFFEQMLFNNGGNVELTFGSITDIEVAVIRQKV